MLKVPAFKHYNFSNGESATVFQDDAQFWKFSIIPGFPTVRRLEDGSPVFMLVKYLLSDESREENPDLPRGGGYMVFDAELRISQENEEEVVADLQSYVNQEFDRLKNLPNDKLRTLTMGAAFNDTIGGHWSGTGHRGTPRASSNTGTSTTLVMPGTGVDPAQGLTEAPTVVIGEPLWMSGKVTMNAPTSAGLVNNMIGERPASLIGNNVAAFSIDLTPDGATFMQKTLVNEDGSGGTDLSPIQVTYELTMQVKLPPASLYIKFNTASVYHAVQELFHEHNNCSDDYFTSETMMTSAIESGLLTVKIDMGGITDEDVMQMIMSQANSTVQQLLAEKFADKERAPLEEWANEDVQEESREIYRLKRETEISMTTFEQTMEINTSAELKIAPQGTLATFFQDQQDMSPFVRVVDTNDPFFKTLGLKVRAFAQWETDDIAFVEVEVKYGSSNELKTNTFTFTPTEQEPQEWDPSLDDNNREYKYRWRVGFEGREAGEWSREEPATTRNLNIAVETPGKLNVEVTGVGLDFENVLDAVLVHLKYEDRSNDIPLAGQSILISADRRSGTWQRNLFAPWEKPLEFRTDFLLKSGTTIESTWEKTDGPSQNLLISRPDEVDVLDLTIIPAGRWTDVVQAVASFRYEDGDYHQDKQFNFKKIEEFKRWAVLLLDPGRRKFEYKILATFNNGDTQETDWLERDGDQAVPIEVQGPPRLVVKASGQVIDYASTSLAKIDFQYKDPAGIEDNASFTFQSDTDVHTWSLPINEGGPLTYQYKITYFPVEGDPVDRDWVSSAEELIVVPRYSIPKAGAEFRPVLQNFALTPAVEVNLTYDDPQRGVHEAMTLIFTETDKQKQSWFIPVDDDAPRTYEMTITWFYANGGQHTSKPIKLKKPAVMLPRPPAPEES